jgi:hypothetical protein
MWIRCLPKKGNLGEASLAYPDLSINHKLNSVLLSATHVIIYPSSQIIRFFHYFCARNFPFKICHLLPLEVEDMKHLFCDCCGDSVNAVYPCKFVFHDGLTCEFNICLECMEKGTLKIDLQRKRLVSKILSKLSKKRQLT